MKNTVTQSQIDEILKKAQVTISTVGDKTTVAVVELYNGFTIVEASSCVDPENYDVALGTGICMKRVEDKLWELEGYWLQKGIHIGKAGEV